MSLIDNSVNRAGSSASSHNSISAGSQTKSASSAGASAGRNSYNFEQGQVFKGYIVDLRGHEVKIELPNEKVISAKLEDSSALSIGQSASFKVTSASLKSISLKVISANQSLSINTAINKALYEAGLPKIDKNIQAVRELLNNQLSIDKKSIYQLLQLSASHEDASMASLAKLLKLNIPVTDVNATWMDNYMRTEHELMPQLSSFVDTLLGELSGDSMAPWEALQLHELLIDMSAAAPESYSGMAETADAALQNNSSLELLSKLFPDGIPEALLPAEAEASAGAASASASLVAAMPSDFPLSSLLSGNYGNEQLLDFVALLDSYGISDELRIRILDGSAGIRETAQALLDALHLLNDLTKMAVGSASAMAADEDGSASDMTAASGAGTAENNNADINGMPVLPVSQSDAASAPGVGMQGNEAGILDGILVKDAVDAAEAQKASIDNTTISELLRNNLLPNEFSTPLIHEVLAQYDALQQAAGEIAAFLPEEDRMQLLTVLSHLKLSPDTSEALEKGVLTARQFLEEISAFQKASQTSFPAETYSHIKALLRNNGYREVIHEELLRHWTLTPQELAADRSISKHLEKLNHDMNSLMEFSNFSDSHGGGQHEYGNQAEKLQENISFMKTLNDIFPYLQLPLRLSRKNTQCELYVYARDKASLNSKDKSSVLLHLDMEHLGPLDIRVELERKQAGISFLPEDTSSVPVLEGSLSSLASALKNKGFTASCAVKLNVQKPAAVNDFISPPAPVGDIKRYSFDIRA